MILGEGSLINKSLLEDRTFINKILLGEGTLINKKNLLGVGGNGRS